MGNEPDTNLPKYKDYVEQIMCEQEKYPNLQRMFRAGVEARIEHARLLRVRAAQKWRRNRNRMPWD